MPRVTLTDGRKVKVQCNCTDTWGEPKVGVIQKMDLIPAKSKYQERCPKCDYYYWYNEKNKED